MNNIEELIRDLCNLAPIKTWSLIVTLFGDLDGKELTGKQLRTVLEPLGIKPEATRVALHRLKNDGWIVSEKSGREVAYQLSKHGLKATDAVYTDVYSQIGKYPQGWQLFIVGETQAANDDVPVIHVGRHLAMTPRALNGEPDQSMEVEILEQDIPDWFQQRFLQPETILLADKLATYVAKFEKYGNKSTATQKRLIRLLILHHWRKMALRAACWAHIGLLPDGAVSRCHRSVTNNLHRTDKIKL